MNPGQRSYAMYVGIDVAATSASVALMEPDQNMGRNFTIEQTEDGITMFIAKLKATDHPASQVHIVMEATGTYWMRLAGRLHQNGFAVSVINPAQAGVTPRKPGIIQNGCSGPLKARYFATRATK